MMPNRTTPPRAFPTIAALGLAAAIGTFAATSTPAPQTAPPPGVTPTPVNLDKFPTPAAAWKEVDRLQQEQKMQAALDLATKIRDEAQKRGDQPEWARGLVRETQLRMALH